ncbi:hypothetical protein FRC14_000696 [Serendipita sp. 396]|nr:hypothetical protein FRC14_000696 [Serendipita sp. 396]KAG8800441.1 hypothetical protein FRC16_002876 [Serendipita sp. 398]KAG8823202.1 hypothetical protein FRC19_004390 [Serendipita sp. 401]
MLTSDSDQARTGRKLTSRRINQSDREGSDRSPSKLTRLFRGVSESLVPPVSQPIRANDHPGVAAGLDYDLDSRRNAGLFDVSPEDLRPPSVAESFTTSRFTIVFPPSPPPDSLHYQFDGIQGVPHHSFSLDSLTRSGSGKRFLPRFKSPLGTTSRPTRLFSRKRKQRAASLELDGEPLDGEEGELIDDEACFMDQSISKGMDILRMFPDEISIYILSFVDMSAILSCLRVSRHWQYLADDNLIWRAFFYRAGFNIDANALRPTSTSLNPQALPMLLTPSSPLSSSLSRIASYLPGYPSSLRASVTSFGTSQSVESSLQVIRQEPALAPAPLNLDWKSMYKARLHIEQLMVVAPPQIAKLAGHADAVYCVEYDGDKIVTGSRDRTICVWTIRNSHPKLKMTLTGHQASVLCLQFDHTGTMVSGSSDWTVIVWDMNADPANRVVDVLREHKGGVLDIKMDPKRIVSCSKDTHICIWDRTTRRLLQKLSGHDGPVNAIGLQDDRVVSVSGDGKMIMWDIVNGRRIRTFEGHERGVACVVYKDDWLISGSNDKRIKIWDPKTGECLSTLSGHEHLVRSLSFNPGTKRLVSTSYDRSIRIWDVSSRKCLREFLNVHDSHIFDVVFRVSKIISASHDKGVVIMDFAPHDLDTSLFA